MNNYDMINSHFGFFLFMREEKNMNILIFYSNNNKNKNLTKLSVHHLHLLCCNEITYTSKAWRNIFNEKL